MSTPASILQGIQADQTTKADAWEAYNSAKDFTDLTPKLMNVNIPQETKAQLWELKKQSSAAQAPMPITSKATIGPSQAPTDMMNKVSASGVKLPDIENYTQQGRAEHPVLSRIGDV